LELLQAQPSALDILSDRLSGVRSFALVPCSHYARKIAADLRQFRPDIYSRLIGGFDQNENVNFRSDIDVYRLDRLPEFSPEIVVAAVSRFYNDILRELAKLGIPFSQIHTLSALDDTLRGYDPSKLAESINGVVRHLADDKSKMDYLLVWMSHLLMDESILSIYTTGKSNLIQTQNGSWDYAGYELEGIYEAECLEELSEEIYRIPEVKPETGDVVFDLGAYRGDTVAFFEKYIGPAGYIYAFEPDETNAQYLHQNIKKNRFENVLHVPNGVYNQNGHFMLTAGEGGGSNLFVLKNGQDTDAVCKIELTTLDSYVEQYGINKIDFVKADIEGCELEMLQGGRRTLKRFYPKLSLALYHRLNDLLDIPLYLIENAPEYRVYIRQRSQRPQATVMYAIRET
jgi:FkbM family methyltransferase